jgi:hypothetical protein
MVSCGPTKSEFALMSCFLICLKGLKFNNMLSFAGGRQLTVNIVVAW